MIQNKFLTILLLVLGLSINAQELLEKEGAVNNGSQRQNTVNYDKVCVVKVVVFKL